MNLTIVGWMDDVGWVVDGIDSFGKSATCCEEFSGLRPMTGGTFLKWGFPTKLGARVTWN